jgi:hypothetical protein
MTAKKNLKRLVRARARKTGESYAAALSQLRKERSSAPGQPVEPEPSGGLFSMRRIEKSEHGFVLTLADSWKEEPPDTRNSPWEVARFVTTDTGPGWHRIFVFRHPAPRSGDARLAARLVQPALERAGFGNFQLVDAELAGCPATQLDFERTAPGGFLACRQYRVVVGDITLCLGLSTPDPERDFAPFDAIVDSLELTGDLATAAPRPLSDPSIVVERPEHGFALEVPSGWEELLPNRRANPWEVARFVEIGDRRHFVSVSRRVAPSLTASDLADEARTLLAGLGYGGFQLSKSAIAGQAALRMDCEQRDAGRMWAARWYFATAGGTHQVLGLETAIPEQDQELFDRIAAGFRLLAQAVEQPQGGDAK